jgi:Na+-transporting methylmalonyl-CoA/oxaloacetate decarboxylase gamma subunit
MSEQKPTRSDPTPEQRVGDSSIKPVVIAFVVTVLVVLVAAIIFIKARQTKVIPKATDPHPTTQMMQPPSQTPAQLRRAIATSFSLASKYTR